MTSNMSDHDQRAIFMSRTYYKYPVLERDAPQSDGLEEGRNICILGVNVLADALVDAYQVMVLRKTNRRVNRSNSRIVQRIELLFIRNREVQEGGFVT